MFNSGPQFACLVWLCSKAMVCVQDVTPFDHPKVELEQYSTGAHIAAHMMYTVSSSPGWTACIAVVPKELSQGQAQVGHTYDELESRTVIDLGCGTVRSGTVVLQRFFWCSSCVLPHSSCCTKMQAGNG